MRNLTLGIVAHVDAGKTSLTERLLHVAGVTDELGSVDAGTTRTDSLELERRRGITIKAAVVSFEVGDTRVNLIDTPGHPDFIAEVERSLGVLDAAVLVVSAVEGVQPQTRILMRALRRLDTPTVLFVNKTDRRGADVERVLAAIRTALSPDVVAMAAPSSWLDVLARHDDALLGDYLSGRPVGDLCEALAAQVARGRVFPVFAGSAVTGAGVDELVDGLTSLLPVPAGDGPTSGSVFKVGRGPAGERIAYVRMFAGSVSVRDRLPCGRVTAGHVFDRGRAVRRESVVAGEIATLTGLADVCVGDAIGAARTSGHHFAPPTLETVVTPARDADRGALHVALAQLADQDPLIDVHQDGGELSVSLYGEVQKEVIGATLAADFGVDVTFRETTMICVERVVGSGSAEEIIDVGENPFLATVGLRVDPSPVGSGVAFRLEVELGSMPQAFFAATEEGVRAGLRRGPHGWRVPDAVVTMTRSGYWARQSHAHGTFDKSMSSTAGDFRNLAPRVLAAALRRAGTEVLQPMHRFALDAPADLVLATLGRLGAVPDHVTADRVEGVIPAARVRELQQRLPTLTSGEGVLESAFDHYAPASSPSHRARSSIS